MSEEDTGTRLRSSLATELPLQENKIREKCKQYRFKDVHVDSGHPRGNKRDDDLNSLPSQLGPFTFERISSSTGKSCTQHRHSAHTRIPSFVPEFVPESVNPRPVSMSAANEKTDEKRASLGMTTQDRAAIVEERAQRKNERIETWITDIPAESLADPETISVGRAAAAFDERYDLLDRQFTEIERGIKILEEQQKAHAEKISRDEKIAFEKAAAARNANNTTSQQAQTTMPHFPFLDSPPPMETKFSRVPVPVSRHGQGRSKPSEDVDRSAIRGNFIPISKSVNKTRSPSPKREPESRDVILQLSLTDSQMDRLTNALSQEDEELPPLRGRHLPQSKSSKQEHRENNDSRSPVRNKSQGKTKPSTDTPSRVRSRSPVKFWKKNENAPNSPTEASPRERSRSPVKFWSNSKSQNTRHVTYDLDKTPQSASKQPGHRQMANNIPGAMGSLPSSLRREDKGMPKNIESDPFQRHTQASPTPARRRSRGPTVAQHPADINTLSSNFVPPNDDDDSTHYATTKVSSSVYSDQDEQEEQQDKQDEFVFNPSRVSVSPLRIRKEEIPKHISVLQGYSAWMNSPCVPEPDSDGSNLARLQQARGSDRATNNTSVSGEPQYSALAPFTEGRNPLGQTRMASKTLIGHDGWLENTSKPIEPKNSPERKRGFLNNLVKKAKGMMTEKGSEAEGQRKSRESDKIQPGNTRSLAVSLNPREQSLVYCELEYTLTTALNDYITAEFNAGRLEADKLKKISEMWQQRGRPKVMSFRYDLETQLELVKLHVNDFKFYGSTVLPTAIVGILDGMKVNARVLRVRTFCQPDTVIAKQLLDSQTLFNVIGCPEHQQIQLAEIIDFFKAALERERLIAERGHTGHQGHQGPSLGRSKSAHVPGEKWHHKSSSTQNQSHGSHHQSYGTQGTRGAQHQSHGTQGTQGGPHQSYGTQGSQHPSHGTQHQSHGTQGSQHQTYGANRKLHPAASHAVLNMDPAEHDDEDDCF